MANINSGPFTTRPEIDGTFGVATSTHWIATAVAMSILERGGNAFDAGIAGIFALQVVEPHLNGPLGDVPVIMFDVRTGKPQVVCGQGPAPAGATIAHYRDHLGLDIVPGSGLLAACVPGTFPTYMHILKEHGTMRLADVLEPAIGYALNGYPLVERACAMIASVEPLFREHWTSSAEVYLPGGRKPEPMSLFTNKRHAETYQRLLAEAQACGGSREAEIERAEQAWSQGFVAEAVDRFCRTEVYDVTQRHNAGVLTGQDMANWKPRVEDPLSLAFGDFEVLKAGPWTQGPVLLQQLALLKQFDLGGMHPTDPDFIHLWVECAKLAYADREAFYADPDFTSVPMDQLLSDEYNAARAKLVDMAKASMDLRPGAIEGFGGAIRTGEASAGDDGFGVGEPTVGKLGTAKGDTVHINVIDKDGNMFGATPSGGWLQSSPVIPELGFPLGSRAQMFWLDEANPSALAPGKRPRSTLSVSMAFRDGAPYMVWGTPGGDQQDQWNAQFFLRHAVFGLNLQEAIDAPAWHSEHFPASFYPRAAKPGVLGIEDRVGADTIADLEARGHIVNVGDAWTEGRLVAASRDGVRRRAAANPRGMQGYAAGR
jgi:gamma-glutamyltranspeptidase/glutathione hydrolase